MSSVINSFYYVLKAYGLYPLRFCFEVRAQLAGTGLIGSEKMKVEFARGEHRNILFMLRFKKLSYI